MQGGGRGIGVMLTRAFIANGATVYISSRDATVSTTTTTNHPCQLNLLHASIVNLPLTLIHFPLSASHSLSLSLCVCVCVSCCCCCCVCQTIESVASQLNEQSASASCGGRCIAIAADLSTLIGIKQM